MGSAFRLPVARATLGNAVLANAVSEVIEAVRAQLDLYTHTCFQVLTYEPYVELAEKLNALAPGERLSYGKSGLTVIYGDNGAGKSSTRFHSDLAATSCNSLQKECSNVLSRVRWMPGPCCGSRPSTWLPSPSLLAWMCTTRIGSAPSGISRLA